MHRPLVLSIALLASAAAHAIAPGNIDTVAGGGFEEGAAALSATFSGPRGVAADASGNVFVADTGNARVRKILPDGSVHTAWIGSTAPTLVYFPYYYNGPANCPGDLAVDAAGNVYVADPCAHVVRKIDTAGRASVVAGKPPVTVTDPTGDNGPATDAALYFPSNIAVDAAGTLFIAEPSMFRIRKVVNGIITTVPGSIPAFAWSASIMTGPIAADGTGGVFGYIPDHYTSQPDTPIYPRNRVFHVDAAGNITTVAGNGGTSNSGDGGPASAAGVAPVLGMMRDGSGNLVLAFADRIRAISGGNIDTVATVGGGDIAASGSTFLVTSADTIARITPPAQGVVFAGGGTGDAFGDGGNALLATLRAPTAVALDAAGIMYIADTGHHRIRKVDTAGNITTLAGTGVSGYSGDGGSAAAARLAGPTGVAIDAAGNVFVADRDNHRVRKIDSSGVITTHAGTGVAGVGGDGGPAAAAQLSLPSAVAIDASGNVLIADYDNERIRRVTPAGTISTVAGGGSVRFSPTVSPAPTATQIFMEPTAIALDTAGNVLVADYALTFAWVPVLAFDAAWKIRAAITNNEYFTLAGRQVNFRGGYGVAGDPFGRVFATDLTTHAIFQAGPGTQRTVLAGTNGRGYSGDGAAAASATFDTPKGLYFDAPSGMLYVADSGNNRIRAIAAADPYPAPFSIPSQSGVAPASAIVSQPVLPSGFRGATSIAAAGGDYSIGCTGTYASAPGTLNPGDSVCVRQTSSALGNAMTTATLTIGGRSAPFVVRTAPGAGSASLVPPSLAFGGQSINTNDGALSITVTNTGATALTVNDFEIPSAFALGHTCTNVAAGATCTLTLTFTPGIEGAIAGTMTLHFTFGDVSVALSGVGEKSLSTHYYRAILRRDPEPAGTAFWDGEAARAANLGANPNEAWYAMAAVFFGSPEYAAFARTDDAFLVDVYKTFFNRAPDAGGLAFWKGQMASGITRDMIVTAFTFSTEFTNFTTAIFGATPMRAEIDMVTDMYRGFMQRLPDDQGFRFWVGKLRAAQCVAPVQQSAAVKQAANDLAHQFLASPEYANRRRTDPQFLADLYNAIQRRAGDAGGVAYWLSLLNSGTLTRDGVLTETVLKSPEFQGRVNRVISQGCLP